MKMRRNICLQRHICKQSASADISHQPNVYSSVSQKRWAEPISADNSTTAECVQALYKAESRITFLLRLDSFKNEDVSGV